MGEWSCHKREAVESSVLDASVRPLTPEVQTEVWTKAAGFRGWLTRATKSLRNSMSFSSSPMQMLFRKSQLTLGVLRSCLGHHVKPPIVPLPVAQLSTGRRPGQQVHGATYNRTRNVSRNMGRGKRCAKILVSRSTPVSLHSLLAGSAQARISMFSFAGSQVGKYFLVSSELF